MVVANRKATEVVRGDLLGGRELSPLDNRPRTAEIQEPELQLVDLGQGALQLTLDRSLVRVHDPSAHLVQCGQIPGLFP